MKYIFKSKTEEEFPYGCWLYNQELAKWAWYESNHPYLVYDFADGMSIRSASFSIAPQSKFGLDMALKIADEYELIEFKKESK